MSVLLLHGTSKAKRHWRHDAVEKSLGVGSLKSHPGPQEEDRVSLASQVGKLDADHPAG